MSRRGTSLLLEDLDEGVVDAQVLVHAREIRRRGIVELGVWAVACSAEERREVRRRVYGGKGV